MQTRAIERRSRPRVKPPTYRIENECNPEAMPQYFQVSVNVLEARKLSWSNPQSTNSYVIVVLGKKKHRTSIRRGIEEPYYREYFTFELYMSIRDLQRSSLWLAVMEPRCCGPPRLVGEATIDLGAIWAQPHHQVYHKWAQLTLPRDSSAGAVGFLKVDLSIIFRGEVQVIPAVVSDETLEDNLLLPSGSEQQRANYLVTIYGAFSLPNGARCHGGAGTGAGDRRYAKPPNTFVRVAFCGLVAKTAVQLRNNNPMYCEEISIVEMFPNMNQTIRLEVCSAEGVYNRVLASADLTLSQISHDGENGFLPTFGPSLLHMYGTSYVGTLGTTGEDGPFHRGALLVSLKTTVPFYQQGLRTVNVEPVTPISPGNLWIQEEFCIFCPILEVSMLDRKIAGKLCGVAITIGDVASEKRADEEFELMMKEMSNRKLHYTGSLDVVNDRPVYGHLEFPNSFPVLQLATRLPDFRFRMYRNNMVHDIVADLELVITDVERRLQRFEYTFATELVDELNEALDDTLDNIVKFLDIISHVCEDTVQHYSTELDQKQMGLQKEEIENIYKRMTRRGNKYSCDLIQEVGTGKEGKSTSRKAVKALLAEIKAYAHSLNNVIYKFGDGWPDIVVWLLNSGSRVAYSRISTADIVYSIIPEQCGRNCGRIQTVYMKPLKCPKHINTLATGCFCIAGKVELVLWMGLYRHKSAFEGYMPLGYRLKVKGYDMCVKSSITMVECRAFIYRAKITGSFESSGITYPFLRINALNTVKETNITQNTCTPIWNQVLKIQRLMFTTADRLITSPPVVLVEIYGTDLVNKTELVGRFQIQPVVDDRKDYEYAPKLQWFDIHKGVEYTGQVLMSVQLLQIPEKLLKSTVYSPDEEIFYASSVRDADLLNNDVEPLPDNLIPKSSSYKVDVYWWGLREVNITRKPCVALEIDELTIKSDVICNKKPNSNFPNGRTTKIFETPLNEDNSPINIRLYDSSTFGRTLFLGNNVIKNANKYIVNWLPKAEREASIKSASMMSSNFCQVNQMVVVSKSSILEEDNVDVVSIASQQSNITQTMTRKPIWQRLFRSKEPDEEQFALLPAAKKQNIQNVVKMYPHFMEYNDWWLRFHCSQGSLADNDSERNEVENVTIYSTELELRPEFNKFKDWCATLKLYNGKKTGIPEKDEQLQCGYLKAGIAIYKWPPPGNTVAVSLNGVDLNGGFFADHPSNDPKKFLVRVYVVRVINVMAKDFTGKSNPYVLISCGKKHLGDRNQYVPNTVDPIFGKMYEFRCSLPEDYSLTVSLYDYDSIPPDELIGSTTIDLEDRVYTKHRARVGLSPEFKLTGAAKWRDNEKPSAILAKLCEKNHIPPPMFPDSNSVVVNGVEYKNDLKDKSFAISAERKENICLSLLKNWHTMPLCGYHLVPEHVETRTLCNPDKPGSEQGKIQLWVDILPLDTHREYALPPPYNIDPDKNVDYELRLTIWDVNMNLDNCNRSGNKFFGADIYLKAWIGSAAKAQTTDVHYNITNGEANFNWRMIFNFVYQHARQRLVNIDQGPFTECEEYRLPYLILQLLDNETDEFLGSLRLNLNCMSRGTRHARQCTLETIDTIRKFNMFSTLTLRRWWPIVTVDMNHGKISPVAAVNLELVLLPVEKARRCPVGYGREPPVPLPEPRRRKPTRHVFKTITREARSIIKGRCHVYVAICGVVVIAVGYLVYLTVTMWLRYGRRTTADQWDKQSSHHYKYGIIRTEYPGNI